MTIPYEKITQIHVTRTKKGRESPKAGALFDALLTNLSYGKLRVKDAERIMKSAALPSDTELSDSSDRLDGPDVAVERPERRGRCPRKAV